MRREVLLSLAVVALASAVLAEPPTIEIAAEVRPAGQYALFQPRTTAVSIEYVGMSGVDAVPSMILKDPKTFFMDTRGLKAGRYKFIAVGASNTGEQARAAFTVVVGDIPPGPGPDPDPDPKPDPDGVVPISGDGFRVLVVLESSDRAKLPSSQVTTLTAAEVVNYLNSKCVMGPDGKTREWRVWDKDVPTTAVAKHWADAMKRPRTSLPWVMISTGKTGYEGPLPATAAEFLTLLKKYGG